VSDDQVGGLPEEPKAEDEFENLVLDDDFVRAGTYEPPARTRFAIARYGEQKTSWRQGAEPTSERRRRGRSATAEHHGDRLSPSVSARLPLIVAIVAVAIAAVLIFR
jgi:hypothetical protein